MSWNTYTDRLVESKVELCAIHGKNGAPWAQVPGFSCTPDEVLTVANAVSRNDNGIYGTGALMGGKRWTVIRLEPDAALLVLKGKDPDNMKCTMVIALSTQAVIIGSNKDENVQGSAVRTAVEGLRDYLKQCGY
ncbi:profilin-1-like isoform X2 [Littorina saxatilis]|uniref:Profilin n=1 Tax=Littorina saxatilis TaxID=31220 RepID=A0AAN9ATM4_9CAEN